jgi:hypothetical protein
MELEALHPLLTQAQETEARGVERKLNELLDAVAEQGLREDPSKKKIWLGMRRGSPGPPRSSRAIATRSSIRPRV